MKTAPVGGSRGSVSLLFAWLTTLLLVIMLCGCGGGTSSAPPPPPPLPPAFQPRPFPGDFFMRLPTAAGDGPSRRRRTIRHSKRYSSATQISIPLRCTRQWMATRWEKSRFRPQA